VRLVAVVLGSGFRRQCLVDVGVGVDVDVLSRCGADIGALRALFPFGGGVSGWLRRPWTALRSRSIF
jgi:hypothetical protein